MSPIMASEMETTFENHGASKENRDKQDKLATLEAFGVHSLRGTEDIRARSHSLPAGDLAHLKKKCRKVRFGSLDCDKEKKASGHLVSSDQDLPQLLEAFGISPPTTGRQQRSHTIGPCELEAITSIHMQQQSQNKKKSEEILARLISADEAGSDERLAVLEAFGVIQRDPLPEPRRRCFTAPAICDLKQFVRQRKQTRRQTTVSKYNMSL